ncbi:hypothetical protein [Klebsiella pneumoniae]|uniref:hypothetical protein n=1 Tax=Klebsiella pneumoniae TaxID=573 RepID=UPI0015D70087|nr:hypothetical protein [Klebsiella pneumoniae]
MVKSKVIDYNPARKEIKAAKKCVANMEASQNLDDMEQLWRDCLNHIEKSFTKLLSATTPVKQKFSNIFSTQYQLRKTDKLLVYIKQARDSDNHSIQDISEKKGPAIGINPKHDGDMLHIEKLTFDSQGNILLSSHNAVVEFLPERINVIAVKNRGVEYNPPTSHVGKPFLTRNPVELAKSAIIFYEDWIEASSKHFS